MVRSQVVEPGRQDRQDVDVVEGHHGRGVVMVGADQPDLAEGVRRCDQADGDIVTVRGEHVHRHPAAAQEEQRVARIPLVEDHLTGTELPRPARPQQGVPCRGRERLEQLPVHDSMQAPTARRAPESRSHMSGNDGIEIDGIAGSTGSRSTGSTGTTGTRSTGSTGSRSTGSTGSTGVGVDGVDRSRDRRDRHVGIDGIDIAGIDAIDRDRLDRRIDIAGIDRDRRDRHVRDRRDRASAGIDAIDGIDQYGMYGSAAPRSGPE